MTSPINSGRVVIVGAAETDNIQVNPDKSMLDLHAEASLAALADAGIDPSEVDGVAAARPSPIEVAHHLGINATWLDGTSIGGCSFLAHVRHAVTTIDSGAATTILISHGESGRSRIGAQSAGRIPSSPAGQFEYPYGAVLPYTTFTVPAMRFLHDRDLTVEDLAEVVVAQRHWATRNPKAVRPHLTTVDEVMSDSMVAYPFTRSMCCVVADAGAALVLTSSERAKDLRRSASPVFVLGSGEAHESTMISQMADLGSSQAFRRASSAALASAGLSVADIDHLMVYDAFAHLPLYGLEDLGFVGRGESADFIREGHTKPGGRLPMNTSGGGLSYTHTGMYGMFAIQEAVRQLRGEAPAQVDGVRTSFVQGVGGFFMSAASLVLSNEAPTA